VNIVRRRYYVREFSCTSHNKLVYLAAMNALHAL
jgi:hypothetical protein